MLLIAVGVATKLTALRLGKNPIMHPLSREVKNKEQQTLLLLNFKV